ncbi:glycosyltransferase, partial [archaeon]
MAMPAIWYGIVLGVFLVGGFKVWDYLCTSVEPSSSLRRRLIELPVALQLNKYEEQLAVLLDTFSTDIYSTLRWNYMERDGTLYQLQSSATDSSQVSLVPVSSSPHTACSRIISSRLQEMQLAQSDVANLTLLPQLKLSQDPMLIPSTTTTTASLSPLTNPSDRMLIVYTTCNQLAVTQRTLMRMRVPADLADLVVVDDHSTDGTVAYLQGAGYAVVSKPRAEGLTDSWNIGYRLAASLGYPYLLLMNNDVLVPPHSLRLLALSLRDHPLVAPLTTEKGAGHNPAQSLARTLHLDASLVPYMDDYRNADALQSLLELKFNLNQPNATCSAVPSQHQGKPKFNGFCFGVNMQRIAPAAHQPNVLLFDPAHRIVGQEDSLMVRMATASLSPMILPCVFLFHFKAATVSLPDSTVPLVSGGVQGSEVVLERVGTGPMARIKYRGADNGTVSRLVDLREDLARYHP